MEKYVRVDYTHGFERLEVYHESEKKFTKNNYINNFIYKGENKTSHEEIERISLSRTKRHIRELCLCNDFEYFVTFTVNRETCNRVILSECQDMLRKKLKAYKRKNAKFGYLIITEKHTKSEGFHFHGFVKGIDIKDLKKLTSDDFDYSKGHKLPYKLIKTINAGHDVYNFNPFNSLGFNTLMPIYDYVACCMYISKYITKDCVRNEHNQIYICSRGLKKAQREELIPFDIDKYNYKRLDKKTGQMVDALYSNDYCKYIDLNKDLHLNPKQRENYTFEIIPKKEFNRTHIDF